MAKVFACYVEEHKRAYEPKPQGLLKSVCNRARDK
jgi:hypothetical protein